MQARVLEKLLFARCTSRESYLNCRDNLDVKLQSVLAVLLERRLRKNNQRQPRQHALIVSLGGTKKYHQVASLVSEIQRLRMGLPVPTTTTASATSTAPKQTAVSSSTDPVRDLYFRAGLVTAFELSPREDFDAMPWNNLISQAEKTIGDYRVWITSQKS